jgi:predicted CXXCH cytochrome family protein
MMLLLAAQTLYVGNQACAPCHVEIYRAYSKTPMAQSSGRVSEGLNPGEFRHSGSGTDYRIEPTGLVTASRGALRTQQQLAFSIGSGAAGKSFLYWREGFLFEAPVTWFSRLWRWDVSPGYENDDMSRWNRPAEPECLNCHASQIRSSAAYSNRYADPPFTQDGVGCERCHGPGSEHVQGKGTLVNPARLPPAQRDSVCAQCHMSGEVRINRSGRSWMDYRPGSRLSDSVAYFVKETGSELKAAGYVEKLAASRCKAASGDRLWCGSCHDPHRTPAPEQRVAWYRTRCLTCHATSSCGRPGDCTACHMPKAKVVDVNHGVLTDHAIPKTPGTLSSTTRSWKLKPFSAADQGDRELGLAYAVLAFQTGEPRQETEALRLLTTTAPDREVLLALAGLYQRRGDYSRSLALYRPGTNDPGFAPTLVNLGVYFGLNGRMEEAIAAWKGVLKQNPCMTEAGVNLKKALGFQGDFAAAKVFSDSQAGCIF